MKNITFIVLLMLVPCVACIAQKRTTLKEWLTKLNIPQKEGYPFYEVVDSLNADSATIYKACKTAVAEAFQDSKDVIRLTDDAEGHIIGKGVVVFQTSYFLTQYNILVRFTVDMRVKGKKYRVQLKDIYDYEVLPSNVPTKLEYACQKLPPNNVERFLTAMDSRLKSGMKYLLSKIDKAVKDEQTFEP